MKLDPTVMRTMNRQDFRVLAAVETGMKNHALVPSPLIASIANLRHGGTSKILSSLLRDKLLSHDRSCGYDGYRLTNSGYDILALSNLKSRGIVAALGDRIGTGKESDVYLAASPSGKQIVLKLHRLGRTSFRDVKKKRDYFMVNAVSKNKKRGGTFKTQPNSWLFLSRISALKEYAFMKALHNVGYPTPTPIGHNRHVVVMGLVRGVPLYQIHPRRVSEYQAESIFQQSTKLAIRLAKHGLVHCDLNEFNLMVDLSGVQGQLADGEEDIGDHYVRHSGLAVEHKGALSAHGPIQKHTMADGTGEVVTEEPPKPSAVLENGEPVPVVTLIDFPQMVSTRHPNAEELYQRDWDCLKRFFVVKLKCMPEGGEWVVPNFDELVNRGSNKGSAESGGEEEEGEGEIMASTSKNQIRLDEELKASGFSEEDAGRDLELYYYEKRTKQVIEENDGAREDGNSEDDYSSEAGGSDGDEDHDSHGDSSISDEEHKTSHPDRDNNENYGQSWTTFDLDDDDVATVFTRQSRAVAEDKARERVRHHIEDKKKRGGRKGAFKSRNTNKTYHKGKRILNDNSF